MTYYVFSFQPCSNVAPFEALPVPREIGFTTDDHTCPGEYLGDLVKAPDGSWCYLQRTVSFRIRLTPRNLRSIADRIDHLTNEEEKLHAKASKKNRQTQNQRRTAALQRKTH